MKARTQAWVMGVGAFLGLGIVLSAILLGGIPTEQPSIGRDQRGSMVMTEPTVPPQEADYGECTPGDPDHPVSWCSPFGPKGKVMYCDETGKVRIAETCSFWCWEDNVGLGGRIPYCISAGDVLRLKEVGVITFNR